MEYEKQHQQRIESQENKEEYKKLNLLQKFLEKCGLKVWREVIPDQCRGWEHPYSVDLIFEILNYGLIGIEGKNLRTHGQGSKYAEAYLQIRDKYKDKTYFNGKKVRRWCVSGLVNHCNVNSNVCFIEHFFNRLGISYIEFEENKVIIDANTQHRLDIISGIDEIEINGINKDCPMDYGKMIK